MASLAVLDLRAHHGDREVLHGIDLDVADGEVLAVVGPSGSGKSTLLRVVAGLHPASGGTVALDGRDVTALAPAARDVAMVFQSYALFPHLDVAANIGFGLAVRKVPRAEASDRVARAAELVGCAELLGRRPDQLSGGERQRVALARALVREPEVLLLDEPLSNLDAQLRVQVRAELQRLRQRVTTTTVHVTHDQVEAMTLGDRVAVVHEGAIQQVATPSALWERPANRFVATFVGSPAMNVVRAHLVDGHWLAGALRASAEGLGRVSAPAELGVRPEHLAIEPPERADTGEGRTAVGPRAQVALVEVVGGEAWVHVTAPGAPDPVVVRVAARKAPAVGASVALRASPGHAHLFDLATGARIATHREGT